MQAQRVVRLTPRPVLRPIETAKPPPKPPRTSMHRDYPVLAPFDLEPGMLPVLENEA